MRGRALDDLSQAGLPRTGEAHIVSVASTWLRPPPLSTYEMLEANRSAHTPAELEQDLIKRSNAAMQALALALAERARDRVQTNFPKWKVSVASACGSAAWELVAKADAWKPDLIVVGSHGAYGAGPVRFGQRFTTCAD